jgi:long-chain fatty acid transport protein
MVSFSLGGKAVYADRGMILKGSSAANNISVDYEYTALGFTPVLGINVKPVRDLNIGIRYEYETGLEFKYKEKKLGGTSAAVTNANNLLGYMHISDGAKLKQNLPQILALGVEYAATPEMALMSSVNFYFLNCADLGAV